MYALAGKTVFVAGHRGMVGSAIVRRLESERCRVLVVGREELDLRERSAARAWLAANRPHAVFVAAATVGGIAANEKRPADFLYDNLMIGANLVEGAHRAGAEKLLFLGSSCIYPRQAPQPIAEEALLAGPLEATNEAYAIAKIAGLKLVQAWRRQHGADFISAMPPNIYGPGDNYDPEASHVLPALLKKAHEVKVGRSPRLTVWGTGAPRREFLHADDCADACVFLMKNYSADLPINIGAGRDIAVAELARLVCEVVGITPDLDFDASRPDGAPSKLMSDARLRALGWTPRIGLRDGIAGVYGELLRTDPSFR